jgi:hypothetical protein
MSSQDYAAKIREQARNAVSPHVAGLGDALRELQANLSTVIQGLGAKVELLRELEIPTTEAIVTEAVNEATEAASRQGDAERAALTHFAYEMRTMETQEELLNLLLDEASRYAPRAGLFIVREDRFQAWDCRGFSESTRAGFSSVFIAEKESPFMQKALSSAGLVSSLDFAAEAGTLEFLVKEASGPWHAFPLIAIRRPVAVLLAAAADTRRCDIESLCLIMNITGLCLENLALKILQEMRTQAHVPAPAPSSESTPGPVAQAVEVPPEAPKPDQVVEDVSTASDLQGAAPEETAPVNVEPVAAEPPSIPEPAVEPEIVEEIAAVEEPAMGTPEDAPASGQELVVEPATEIAEAVAPAQERSPEAEIAVIGEVSEVLAAPEFTAQAMAPPAPEEPLSQPKTESIESVATSAGISPQAWHESPEAGTPKVQPPQVTPFLPAVFPAPSEAQRLSEEEKLHSDAKRFARLLVSEIKLYNEQRVLEGRDHRDIYVRLKRDIDRSREMYQKRVAPSVVRKVDYFHDEIVRILGDNDPSTLGSDYPGPLVES